MSRWRYWWWMFVLMMLLWGNQAALPEALRQFVREGGVIRFGGKVYSRENAEEL